MNKLQLNLYRNWYIFIHENPFENIVCEVAAMCLGVNVLNVRIVTLYTTPMPVDL